MGLLFYERRWGVPKDCLGWSYYLGMDCLPWSSPFCLFLEGARLLPPNNGYFTIFLSSSTYLGMYSQWILYTKCR